MQCYKEYLAISRKVGDQKAEALACNSIGVAYQVRYSRAPERAGGRPLSGSARPPVMFGLFGFLRGIAGALSAHNGTRPTGRRPTVLNTDESAP
jgi:hypothetical protein